MKRILSYNIFSINACLLHKSKNKTTFHFFSIGAILSVFHEVYLAIYERENASVLNFNKTWSYILEPLYGIHWYSP